MIRQERDWYGFRNFTEHEMQENMERNMIVHGTRGGGGVTKVINKLEQVSKEDPSKSL